ncbi:ParB N-terminal domain-containing protein [Streptomyces sp. BI20]|uniref:ParB N-terminal domain-containing protein n=1 Tax=Streptomyces sp. BI20 TaxID=3403460 RepID=UPI003C70E74D
MTAKTKAEPTYTPQWETLPVATLAARPANLADSVPPMMLAAVTQGGVVDPLYIVESNGEIRVVDGTRLLRAAVTAGIDAVPVTRRAVMRVADLMSHPANVRPVRIDRHFVESIRTEGCRVPIKIQYMPNGGARIIDGHRRFGAARQVGITHVPVEVDQRDDAGQIIDMITTARHREDLTTAELTGALFAAAEAGADPARVAKAGRVRQKDVKTARAVMSNERIKKAVSRRYDWTLDEMEAVAEFADEPNVVDIITEAAEQAVADKKPDPAAHVAWVIRTERNRRAVRMAAQAHRAELEAGGARIRDLSELSERATPVWRLKTTTGKRITTTEHAECKGLVWVLEDPEEDTAYQPYCVSPALYGHAAPGAGKTGEQITAEAAAAKAARSAVKKGNAHWDTATECRRQWIANLVQARTLPRDIAAVLTAHVTAALVDGTWRVASELNKGPVTEVLAKFLNLRGPKSRERSEFTAHIAKSPARALAFQWATVAAVQEKGAGSRVAWRTDEQRSNTLRSATAEWLRTLEAIGYSPSPIERAVMNDEEYHPSANHPKSTVPTPADEPADPASEPTPLPVEAGDDEKSEVEEPTNEGADDEEAVGDDHQAAAEVADDGAPQAAGPPPTVEPAAA